MHMQKDEKKFYRPRDRSGSTNENATALSGPLAKCTHLGIILKPCPLPPGKFQKNTKEAAIREKSILFKSGHVKLGLEHAYVLIEL